MLKLVLILSLVCLVSCEGNFNIESIGQSLQVGNKETKDTTPEVGGVGFQLDITPEEVAELQTLMGSGMIISKIPMSNNNQTGSYELGADGQKDHLAYGLPANIIYNALNPSTPAPNAINFTSGITALEFDFDFPEIAETPVSPNPNGILYQTIGGIVNGLMGGDIAGVVLVAFENGTYRVSIRDFQGEVFSSVLSYQNLPTRVGIEFNANTSTFKVYFDDVPQVLSRNSYVLGSYHPVIAANETIANPVGNRGLLVKVRLITTGEDMTTQFSDGANDTLGNPLP